MLLVLDVIGTVQILRTTLYCYTSPPRTKGHQGTSYIALNMYDSWDLNDLRDLAHASSVGCDLCSTDPAKHLCSLIPPSESKGMDAWSMVK